jgi:hypothetical protein
MQIADMTAPAAAQAPPALCYVGLWFVLLALAGTTLLHYLTDIHLIPYHSIYRSLYYVPIAVAAMRYGRRGGVLTGSFSQEKNFVTVFASATFVRVLSIPVHPVHAQLSGCHMVAGHLFPLS